MDMWKSHLRKLKAALFGITALLSALAICKPSFADHPCPPSPCTQAKASHESCDSRADWVVVGVASYVHNGLNPFGGSGAWVWDLGRLELADAVVVKGQYPISDGKAVLKGASHCYATEARVPTELKGSRIRVFGTSAGLPPWGQPGVIGFEIEPSVAP